MMGADAVVDLNAERLPGFIRTEHRASGTAVRAVDDEGRLELKSRWFAGQIGHLKMPLLALALLDLLLVVFPLLSLVISFSLSASVLGKTDGLIAGLLWRHLTPLAFTTIMTTLTVGTIVSRWPQLMRPTAVCFMANAVQYGLLLLAELERLVSLVLSLLGVKPGFADLGYPNPEWVSGLMAASTALMMIWRSSILFLYFYLGRRVWLVGQEYRRLAAGSLRSALFPTRRVLIAALAWCAAIVCALGLIGEQAWVVYRGAVANIFAEGSGRESFEQARAAVADQLNAGIWRQITDPDPAKRRPDMALGAAEPTFSAQRDNPIILKTLGVARYRTGDLAGSIRDLERSIKLGGYTADAAFFLAAAHAQAGRVDQAHKLFLEADEWMRLNQPDDNELKRFREEAAAVLYMASRATAKTETKKGDPPTQKPGATLVAPQ